jgi:hypothetical protein
LQPPWPAAAELEVLIVEDVGERAGLAIAACPGELPGRKPGCRVPLVGPKPGVEISELGSEARFAT